MMELIDLRINLAVQTDLRRMLGRMEIEKLAGLIAVVAAIVVA